MLAVLPHRISWISLERDQNMSRRRLFQALLATVVTVCLLALSGLLSAQGNSANALERAKEVQERHTAKLMAKEGVVGTAISEDESAQPVILALLEHGAVAGIPQQPRRRSGAPGSRDGED